MKTIDFDNPHSINWFFNSNETLIYNYYDLIFFPLPPQLSIHSFFILLQLWPVSTRSLLSDLKKLPLATDIQEWTKDSKVKSIENLAELAIH